MRISEQNILGQRRLVRLKRNGRQPKYKWKIMSHSETQTVEYSGQLKVNIVQLMNAFARTHCMSLPFKNAIDLIIDESIYFNKRNSETRNWDQPENNG